MVATLKGLSFCSLDVRLKKIVRTVGEDPVAITEAGMDLGNIVSSRIHSPAWGVTA